MLQQLYTHTYIHSCKNSKTKQFRVEKLRKSLENKVNLGDCMKTGLTYLVEHVILNPGVISLRPTLGEEPI